VKKESGWMIAVIFLGITMGTLLAGLFISLVLWGISRLLGGYATFFAIVEALSAAVGAAAVFGAGFIAYRELKAMSHSQHLEGADKVFNEFNAEDKIRDRGIVYQAFLGDQPRPFDALTLEELGAIKSVLNSLDRVAFMVYADEDWIPEEMVMPWMHPIIHKCWRSLEAYVKYEQERRNEPYFYEHAAKLGEACLRWRAERGIPDTIQLVQ
jgi:hypothetical protein